MTLEALANILIGATLLVLGCASMVAAVLRPRRGARLLLAFGIAVGLYGARLLAFQPPVQAAIGGSVVRWAYFGAFVTYLINIPLTSFVEQAFGGGWHQSIRWLVWIVSGFAIAAIAYDLVQATPAAANAMNRWLVLLLIVVAFGNVLHGSRSNQPRTVLTERIVVIGAVVLALFIVNENIGEPVLPGTNIESVGMLLFVVCLGYTVVGSVFRAETEFAGVQRELETARRIQLSLLPRRVPGLQGLDVAVRFVPMAAVGGDLYNFVQLGPSSLGILVADVSGHGIPAALVASMVKVAFSAQADRADDPAQVLAGMNQILCRHLEQSFVTAVYAVLDTERQTITIANAGHPPPLLQRGPAISPVDHDHGMMLGFLSDAVYTSTRVDPFLEGDRLLLYSDGVPEAVNRHGEFFDRERVAQWLAAIRPPSAEQFAEAALGELTHWTGGPFDDDVTFVIAERTGTGEPTTARFVERP